MILLIYTSIRSCLLCSTLEQLVEELKTPAYDERWNTIKACGNRAEFEELGYKERQNYTLQMLGHVST